jgi:archaellum component FlaC
LDYEPRIVKLETEMENQKEAITLIRADINKLDNKVETLRGEILTLTRWVAGLVLANASLIVGAALKAAGAF